MNRFSSSLVLAWLLFHQRETGAWFLQSAAAAPSSRTGNLPFQRQPSPEPVPKNVRLLILPGFGNDSSDYFLPQAPQGSLVESLSKRGWSPEQIRVMPVSRTDWLQVFWKGAFDADFWLNRAPPTRPAFKWYLDGIIQNVRELARPEGENQQGGNNKVVLVGHSAGGWLARAAMGFGSTSDSSESDSQQQERGPLDLGDVLGLVTLGTPQMPPPPTLMDMTRGALRITNEKYPGAYHQQESPSSTGGNKMFYLTVTGEAVRGQKQVRKNPLEPTSATGFAYESYEGCCGDGTAVGDGVVPACVAHLEGAAQLTLDGVWHSINVPDKWYGSDAVIDEWHDEMRRQVRRCLTTPAALGTIFENLWQKQGSL